MSDIKIEEDDKMEDSMENTEVWNFLEALGVLEWKKDVQNKGDLFAVISVYKEEIPRKAINCIEQIFRLDYKIYKTEERSKEFEIWVEVEEGDKEAER